jgi:hypothetical protein
MAYIIIHNMILDDEKGLELECIWDHLVQTTRMQADFTYYDLELVINELEDIGTRHALQNDLMDCLWHQKGQCMY